MRKNLVKEKIKAGKVAYSVFVPMWCPAIVEIIGFIGFDSMRSQLPLPSSGFGCFSTGDIIMV